MVYFCSNCGLEVVVIEGNPVKACSCDSAIVAEMESNLKGKGGVN
jgi:DNA-directed RNA polymerase subunit RPC12/RpoP